MQRKPTPVRLSNLLKILPLAVLLIPIIRAVLSSPYIGDDVPNSQLPAISRATGRNFWHLALESDALWRSSQGRFFPITFLERNLVFTLATSLFSYKVVQALTVVLVPLLTVWLTSLLFASRDAGIIFGMMSLLSLQLRNWYDPSLAFNIVAPSVTIKGLLAVVLTLYALRTREARHFVGLLSLALLLLALSLLQYEVSLAFAVCILTVTIQSRLSKGKRRAIVVGTILALVLVVLALAIGFRRGKTLAPAYSINSDLEDFLPAFAKQIFGSFPGSFMVRPDAYWHQAATWDWRTWILFSFAFFLFSRSSAWFFEHRSVTHGSTLRILSLSGLSLLLIPAIPIAFSRRWQEELDWGLAYLPVFIQYVGAAVLLGVLLLSSISWLCRPGLRPTTARVLLAFLFVFLAVVTQDFVFSIPFSLVLCSSLFSNPTNREKAMRLGFACIASLIFVSTSLNNQTVANLYRPWLNEFKRFESSLVDGLLNSENVSGRIYLVGDDPTGFANSEWISWKLGVDLSLSSGEQLRQSCLAARSRCEGLTVTLLGLEDVLGGEIMNWSARAFVFIAQDGLAFRIDKIRVYSSKVIDCSPASDASFDCEDFRVLRDQLDLLVSETGLGSLVVS